MQRVRPDRPAITECGSAVVMAVVLAGVVLVLGTALVARTLGAVEAARGSEERARARLLAETGLERSIRSLASGDAHDRIRMRTKVVASSVEHGDGLVERIRAGATPDELLIEVESRVGAASHRATAAVRPFLSADHLLLLERRVIDPALLGLPRAACDWPSGDPRRSAECRDATLGPLSLDGPVHVREGLVFREGTTASRLTSSVLMPGPDGSPVVTLGDAQESGPAPVVTHRAGPGLPRSIEAVRGRATITCRLRGPTSLRFDGPVVRVRSPSSVPRPDEPNEAGRAIGCMGVDRTLLATVTPIELPADAVIEIVRDDAGACVLHPLGLTGDDADRPWGCGDGSAFVWGRYQGRRTVLAEDDVQVVWDLEPGDASGAVPHTGDDLLGLVAGDSIVLRRPVSPPVRRVAPLGRNLAFAGPGIPPFGDHPADAPTPSASTWDQPRIVASLVALRGSVTLQNPFIGEPGVGPLSIVGSVAGRFPGVFAWEARSSRGTLIGTTGYVLALQHDRRLLDDAPPLLPLTDDSRLRVIHRDVG